MDEPTDYTNSGFDKFLARGDAPNLSGSLDTQNTSNNAVPFDRTQSSGALGDTVRIGNVSLQGSDSQITLKDDSNIRLIIGKQSDGTEGIIISQEGSDADIARPANLIFNSNQDVFKVSKSGLYTFPAISSIPISGEVDQPVTIYHNLGFVPGYQTFTKVTNPNNAATVTFPPQYYLSFTNSISTGDPVSQAVLNTIFTGIDERNMYFCRTAANGDGAATHPAVAITVKYYIYQESIT